MSSAAESGLWEQPFPNVSDRHPPVHDILAALNLSKTKSDRSGEFKMLRHVAGSSQSNDHATSRGPTGVLDAHDRHMGDIDQHKPLLPPCDDIMSVFASVLAPTKHSTASSMLLTPLNQSFQQASGLSRQDPAHPKTAQSPSAQTQVESSDSRAQVLATLKTPTDQSDSNTSIDFLQNTATMPSLSTEPLALQQGYSLTRAAALPMDWPPFCHSWAEIGVNFDKSDFSTDFNNLSPLAQLGTGIHGSSQYQVP